MEAGGRWIVNLGVPLLFQSDEELEQNQNQAEAQTGATYMDMDMDMVRFHGYRLDRNRFHVGNLKPWNRWRAHGPKPVPSAVCLRTRGGWMDERPCAERPASP